MNQELKNQINELAYEIMGSEKFSHDMQMRFYNLLMSAFCQIDSEENEEEKQWHVEKVDFFREQLRDCKDPVLFPYINTFSYSGNNPEEEEDLLYWIE